LTKISNHRNLIICYHSIESKEDWRFETSIINFKEQVKRLNKKFKIVPLSELINDSNVSNRPRASITFDDGYENVYLNALPILSKLGLTGTMFIIGDSKMAVRS
jgi:peptidoglycan/xylan/chitin deacetylase (PgdA/CDA1 family)